MDINRIFKNLARVLALVSMPLFMCFQCVEYTPYHCYREIYNATSQSVCVEFGCYYEAESLVADNVYWEALLAPNEVVVADRPLEIYDRRSEVRLEDATEPMNYKFIFYNADKSKVLYVIEGDDFGNGDVWTSERWQTYPEKHNLPDDIFSEPHAYHTFVYWTFTLTEDKLLK